MKMMQTWLVLWLALFIIGVVNADDAQGSVKKDHNGEPYQALCKLLKIAVYEFVNKGDTLPDPLKAALNKTIFGRKSGGTLEDLKDLPQDYTEGGSARVNFFGQPYEDPGYYGAPHRWSGYSAPHNLVCLCTKGENGWPVNNSGNQDTLCGETSDTLGAGNEGWTGSKTGQAQMRATWKEVVTHCLKGETGGDLKGALGTFLGKLEHKPGDEANPNRYQLGEGKPSNWSGCDGTSTQGVCVMYYNSTNPTKPQPWWVDLQKAIPEDEKLQEQKRREEEERRKQQEETAKQDSTKTDALKSEPPSTNQTAQHRNDNLTDKLRRLNLTSGTPISRPFSWLLSAAILI
ncbi:Variant surface glycoprotein [Trypanosoma congolense IL3000]|uniref:Variant surface glycoprotein n=1 Tax=Trypanosoma congolense (strain IL3000) TaxID=1068625 RepID=F9W9P3_TRYCI|nr:Variant surface glycoprotein [Trypanosoma congolense IL3000]